MERKQARMDESKKKMELMVDTLQTLFKRTTKEDGEKPDKEKGG